jgi:pyruvate/2-oxoglutarate dehydrogenase complex dihydrolipoamide acyltransferase (E2) component
LDARSTFCIFIAERDGTVEKIHASVGATLSVDALILEFA